MSTSTVTLFLAFLAVAAQATAIAGAVLVIGRRRSATLRRWGDQAVAAVAPDALALAAGVALVATLGSLYLSEVANFTPCKLCWYQRIAMYPMVPILGVAAWRRDAAVRWYAVPTLVVGALISSYHVLLERMPQLESGVCDPTNPCTLIWVRRFGYLTIPTMALSAFALILLLVSLAGRAPRPQPPAEEPLVLQEVP